MQKHLSRWVIIIELIVLYMIAVGNTGSFRCFKAPSEESIPYAPDVTAAMYTSAYWLKNRSKDEQWMNAAQIEDFNRLVLAAKTCQMHDLKELSKQLSKENPNVDYGVGVCEAAVRSEPGDDAIETPSAEDYEDDCRLTTLKVNEAVLVDEVSADGLFYHIVKCDLSGWVDVSSVAICKSRQTWLSLQQPDRKLIVTAPMLSMPVTGETITMGTVLRRVCQPEGSLDAYGRVNWGCYTVCMPVRDASGMYTAKLIHIPVTADVQTDYLPYTSQNVLDLAFRYLGYAYGWGGMYHSVDCSQMIQNIYACFGMHLPRNSTAQANMPVATTRFTDGMTDAKRQQCLDALPPGTELFFKGHVMLYLGRRGQDYYVISATGNMENPYREGSQMMTVRSIVINNLSVKRPNGNTWLTSLTCAKILKVQ